MGGLGGELAKLELRSTISYQLSTINYQLLTIPQPVSIFKSKCSYKIHFFGFEACKHLLRVGNFGVESISFSLNEFRVKIWSIVRYRRPRSNMNI